MTLDVWALDRDLMRPDVDGADDVGQCSFKDKKTHYDEDCVLVSPHPEQRESRERGSNEEPAQRQSDLYVHVIRAGHERVRVIEKFVVAQKNPGCKAKQEDYGNHTDESGAAGSRQQ